MFFLWNRFSWFTCYCRNNFFGCSFMKNLCISFNRQSSFRFWGGNFVLTLCGRGMTFFVRIYLLLRFINYELINKIQRVPSSILSNFIEVFPSLHNLLEQISKLVHWIKYIFTIFLEEISELVDWMEYIFSSLELEIEEILSSPYVFIKKRRKSRFHEKFLVSESKKWELENKQMREIGLEDEIKEVLTAEDKLINGDPYNKELEKLQNKYPKDLEGAENAMDFIARIKRRLSMPVPSDSEDSSSEEESSDNNSYSSDNDYYYDEEDRSSPIAGPSQPKSRPIPEPESSSESEEEYEGKGKGKANYRSKPKQKIEEEEDVTMAEPSSSSRKRSRSDSDLDESESNDQQQSKRRKMKDNDDDDNRKGGSGGSSEGGSTPPFGDNNPLGGSDPSSGENNNQFSDSSNNNSFFEKLQMTMLVHVFPFIASILEILSNMFS